MSSRSNPGLLALAAVCTLGAAGAAPAQTGGAGADVIVGDLYDVANYGTATAGGVTMRAYAVGTISCNIGTENLLWIASTNQHPVITQNMYRLHNGRLEQLGQAWLKHGFTALAGNLCSTCNGVSGSRLGVGCSDPYSASLNGGQSGLGPKYEVNPYTGAFPYPFTSPAYSGTLARRLQVRQDELGTAGALYFIESQYVTPDDAAAGNQMNNASYRRVDLAASTFNMVLRDTTQRTEPAIFAWREHGGGANIADPGVTLFSVDVPGDGRFWVAAKATQNQDGSWRYEYAIQNLNSDRAGGSFSVPLPSGAFVANAGFRDVDYHSGEIWDNTDWTVAAGAGGIAWSSPQAHAQNPNSNALRWGTLYNFWFDCDRAPQTGTATLGLFKPGTPSSLSLTLPVPGTGGGGGAPLNDACASAIAAASGASAFTTVGATTDGGSEGACGGATIQNDVWYRYTAPCDGSATVDLCGSAFDTTVAVYTGAACGGAAVVCNEDSCGLASRVTFAVIGGTDYLVRIGSATGETGTGTMSITGPDCAPPGLANDACAGAITLSEGVSVAGTTIGATNDGTASCGSSGASPDVWYAYTPATSAAVTVSTCNAATYDTVLSVHSACGGSQVACQDDATGCSGYSTSLTANLTGGVRYLIRVSGYNGASGDFTLTVTGGGGGGPSAPFNNDCQNRAGVGDGTIPFDTTGATTDGPAHALCSGSGSDLVTNDIWFNYPAQVNGTLTVSLCGSTFDTRLAVYDDTGCTNFDARLLACNDDFACPGGTLQSQVQVDITAGRSYTIRIGGYNGATGTGTLTLASTPSGGGGGGEVVLMSFVDAAGIPGVGTVQNEDIVAYDRGTGQWSLLFDGSDVGLGSLAIDGMALLPSGDILLSFTAAARIPGMTGGPGGSTTLADADIVRFTPTSLGATTAGSFAFYFDGSDVGLTQSAEDIDAIMLADDGRLVISTLGNHSATGGSGNDEDLAVFNATSLGQATAGSFAMHLDGSDVGLSTSNENIDAAARRTGGQVLLSTTGSFSVAGVSGNDEDVLGFTPTSLGGSTAGSFAMDLDLSAVGVATGEDLAALDLPPSGVGILNKGPAAANGPAVLTCPGDFNTDDVVNSGDISAFLTAWIASVAAGEGDGDVDASGAVNSADISAFLTGWVETAAAGCPQPE